MTGCHHCTKKSLNHELTRIFTEVQDKPTIVIPEACYFHVVMTIPDLLNPLIRYNGKVIYDILFRAGSGTWHNENHT